MSYRIVMNENEIRASMSLLDVRALSDVVEIPEDYEPSDDTLQDMLNKHFLVKEEDGTIAWNDFVLMVLWTALHSESELRIDAWKGESCRLLFKGDTLTLLALTPQSSYVFYYLSAIPEAIGGLAAVLDALEDRMGQEPANAKDADPTALEQGNSTTLLTIEGWLFEAHHLSAKLVQNEDSYLLVWDEEGCKTSTEAVGFYSFIQRLIPWVVFAHGRSIQRKAYYSELL